MDAGPGASVAELVDARDSHSLGLLQTQLCMPCGFDSRLGHHQPAVARRGRGKASPAHQTLVEGNMPPSSAVVNSISSHKRTRAPRSEGVPPSIGTPFAAILAGAFSLET